MTADLHTLTGAYVLDAVPPVEHEAFRFHLRQCGPCAREVAELRATAARLGLAVAAPPPLGLRDRVLTAVHGTRRRRVRLSTVAAAVLLAAAAALGVVLADTHQEPGPVATILRADDAALVQRAVAGGRVTLVASHHADRAVLFTRLPPAPAGRTYQAWTVDFRYRSAGVLAADAAVAIDHLGTAVAVTVEPEGGSPQPTSPPLATIPVP